MSWKDGLANVTADQARRIIHMEPTIPVKTSNKLMRQIDEFAEKHGDRAHDDQSHWLEVSGQVEDREGRSAMTRADHRRHFYHRLADYWGKQPRGSVRVGVQARYRDRSKYQPHQGQRERERRMRRA